MLDRNLLLTMDQWKVDTGGGGPLDRTKDGGGIGPDREEIRTDPLLHLHHPPLLGLLGVIDVGRG